MEEEIYKRMSGINLKIPGGSFEEIQGGIPNEFFGKIFDATQKKFLQVSLEKSLKESRRNL